MQSKILHFSYIWMVAALALFTSSCEKKYIEIVPVAELERDISIPNAGDIRFLEFQNELLAYSADSATIYKTTDAGTDWQLVPVPPIAGNISQLLFFNQTHALCLKAGKVYATANSGQTWTYKADAAFIGISTDGKGVYGRSENVLEFNNGNSMYVMYCRVFVSVDQGNTFTHFKNVYNDGYMASFGFVTGNKVYIGTEDSGFRRFLDGVNLITGAAGLTEGLSIPNGIPKQITETGDTRITVTYGLKIESIDQSFSAVYRHLGGFNSGSIYENMVVGAGHHSIIANLDIGNGDYFTELLDVNGQPFKKEFYQVQAVGPRHFYVAGENGLIWKMKI